MACRRLDSWSDLDSCIQLCILESLNLDELMQCTSSCRGQRCHLQEIQRLNICLPSHCNAKLLMRCQSVRTVRAMVVIGEPFDDNHCAVAEIAIRLPFAVTVLPKLEMLLLVDKKSYWHGQESPGEVWDVVTNLMTSLASARRARCLEQLTWVKLGCHSCPQSRLNKEYGRVPLGCSCHDIVSSFPVGNLIDSVANGDICPGRLTMLKRALQRGALLNSPFPGNPFVTSFQHILEGLTPHHKYPDEEFEDRADRMCVEIINYMVELGGAEASPKLLADAASGELRKKLLDPWTDESLPNSIGYLRDYATHMCSWLSAGVALPRFAWEYPSEYLPFPPS